MSVETILEKEKLKQKGRTRLYLLKITTDTQSHLLKLIHPSSVKIVTDVETNA